MTDQIREQISALIDGELPEDEVGLLVRRLERDERLRCVFSRYVLAGEAVRSPGTPLASPGFSARVSAAIGEVTEAASHVRTEVPAGRQWYNRPAFATAIAASAAIAAVLLVGRGYQQAGQVAQDSLERVRDSFAALPAIGQSSSPTPAHSQRLASYLVAHGQFSNPIGRRTAWSSVLASDPGLTRVAFETLEAP
jgi:sigma-E factor negative regulatory protein RseA